MTKTPHRKQMVGEVVSDKMDKAVTLKVWRTIQHSKYKKVVKVYKKYMAQDKNNSAKIGDKVLIEETRPLSKYIRWRIVEVLNDSTEIKA